MIFGIGTDLIAIERIQTLVTKFPEKFPQRILNVNELEEWQNLSDPVLFLAKRFAVKEAFSKALGTGIGAVLSFTDVGVAHFDSGQPYLNYSKQLSFLLRSKGITHSHVSISDEQKYALAWVILEKN